MPPALPLAVVDDQYQLGELLGRGGMGEVHAARNRSGRLVAVKRVRNTLSSDQLLAERLTDEARLLGTVSHPNVVRALDHGTGSDGRPFLVMDRAHGTPLHELIAELGPLPTERIAAIAAQLFAGLSAIHAAGIVHADLKSHNVLVDDVDIVTIIDFGLARTLAEDPSTIGLVAGTPAYMAPEVIAGARPSVAADVYAAATILYEMLTATTPFSGHISTILTHQLSEPVQPPSQRAPERRISPQVDRVLVRALDATPSARYPTVAAFGHAFLAALSGRPTRPLAAGTVAELADPLPARPRRPTAPHAPTQRLDGSDALISAALGHVQQLIEGHQMLQAVATLEASLARLSPPDGDEASRCTAAWRLETVLAALYDSIGKQERARQMALVAYRHAVRSGCPLAKGRAGALVDRLIAQSRRVARGSVGFSR